MEIIKNIDSAIEYIQNLPCEYELSNLPFNDRKGSLRIKDRHLELSFSLSLPESVKVINIVDIGEFSLRNEHTKAKYLVENKSAYLKGSTNLAADDNAQCPYSININNMMEMGWERNEKYFYRFLFPIEKEYWIRDIYTLVYRYKTTLSRGLIPINFEEGTIHLFPVRIEESNFLAIESNFTCTYDEMQKYIYAVPLSLGLVTSIVTFDYAYIFTSETPDFKKNLYCGFSEMRDSIKGQYSFFTTNIYALEKVLRYNKVEYALKQILDEEGQVLSNMQDWMQLDEFEQIVRMLYNNNDLARSVLILIESSTFSLDYEGAMCAVALETICAALDKSQNRSFLPKTEWQKSVSPRFMDLINQLYSEGVISEEHADVIRKKLHVLNFGTNGDKLSSPFRDRGYNLSKKEMEIIKERNRFLHGHILGRTYDESFKEMLYTCMELQKLCTILLFREAGFKGYIINNAVLMGLEQAVNNKEPVLIK